MIRKKLNFFERLRLRDEEMRQFSIFHLFPRKHQQLEILISMIFQDDKSKRKISWIMEIIQRAGGG